MGVSIQQWRLAIGSNSSFSSPSYKAVPTTSSSSSLNTPPLLSCSITAMVILAVLALSYLTRASGFEACSITVPDSSNTLSLTRIGSRQVLWLIISLFSALTSPPSWPVVHLSTIYPAKWSTSSTTASLCLTRLITMRSKPDYVEFVLL